MVVHVIFAAFLCHAVIFDQQISSSGGEYA